jgi:uncharacterized membrane protein
MIKKNWKLLIITSVIILLPILVGLILWSRLPEQVPIHWNATGEIDGWSRKAMAVFGMPLFFLAIHWITLLVTSADPKKKNHSEKILSLIFWLIPILNLIISTVTYCTAMGKSIRMEILVPLLLGVSLVAIGNYLPKCQQNYTIGIKIPWTLSSEENWNRTHRLAGFVWVMGGIIMILSAFWVGIWITIAVSAMMALIPVIYSYALHRKGI